MDPKTNDSVKDLYIFVPAFQCELHLEETIRRIPAQVWDRLLVLWIIDDGSRDRTKAIADRLAEQHACLHVHSFAQNQGYGAVVRQGLQLGLESGAKYLVCLHGDGQYAPELLPAMLDHMQQNDFSVLQGSRHAAGTALQGGMPFYKWMAGKALTWLHNRAFGLGLSDYHSGYLVYMRDFVQLSGFATLKGGFEIDLELIASARAQGFRVGEMPIPTRYANEISHLNPFRYGLDVLGVVFRYRKGAYAAHS